MSESERAEREFLEGQRYEDKFPDECGTCRGYGLWALGNPSPMGPMDARGGMPTLPCAECGASANPASARLGVLDE